MPFMHRLTTLTLTKMSNSLFATNESKLSKFKTLLSLSLSSLLLSSHQLYPTTQTNLHLAVCSAAMPISLLSPIHHPCSSFPHIIAFNSTSTSTDGDVEVVMHALGNGTMLDVREEDGMKVGT